MNLLFCFIFFFKIVFEILFFIMFWIVCFSGFVLNIGLNFFLVIVLIKEVVNFV